MNNNKNLIKALAFIFIFLLGWDYFIMRRYAAPPLTTTDAKAIPEKQTPKESAVSSLKAADTKVPAANAAVPQVIVLKNDDVEITFDSKGAQVLQWKLYERDHWLQVFPRAHSSDTALASFPDLNFTLVSNKPNEIKFSAHHPEGFDIEKTLTIKAEPPFHALTYTFTNRTMQALNVETAMNWTGGITHHTVGEPYVEKQESIVDSEMRAVGFGNRIMSFQPGVIFNRTVKKIVPIPLTWIGVDNTHFLAAIISKENDLKDVSVEDSRSTPPEIRVPMQLTLQPSETKTKQYLLYVGPKQYTVLQKVDYHIAESINFGMFGLIAKGLLHALHFFHGLTHNFGWAIIVLTICVQLLVFPLTRNSLKHSVRMRELQPQLKALQEQLKNDPKRLQLETLSLYKKNGMKLMGMEGCFPLLLQMPIFYAFYTTMRAAYELRGAPWIFWIHDLGSKDPYYVLPILMGVGMFVQQKVTAVAVDPAQARMMMFLPIMFTFMFLQLPSGLVLYWFTNSLMSILIQRILMLQMKSNNASPLQRSTSS